MSVERVNSPSHYRRDGIEIADVIDALGLHRWDAQAFQYVTRSAFKEGGAHEAEDLRKAIWFLHRRLKQARMEADPLDPPQEFAAALGPACQAFGLSPDKMLAVYMIGVAAGARNHFDLDVEVLCLDAAIAAPQRAAMKIETRQATACKHERVERRINDDGRTRCADCGEVVRP